MIRARPGNPRGWFHRATRETRRWTPAQAVAAGLGILVVGGEWGALVLFLQDLDESTSDTTGGSEPGAIREAILEIPDPAFAWAFRVGDGLFLVVFIVLIWTRWRRPRHASTPGPRP